MRPGVSRRVVLLVLACALGGVVIFGGLVWRAVAIERADARQASDAFTAARAALGPGTPLLDVDDQGQVTRREQASDRTPLPISRVKAMTYRADLGRIVRADAPLWFLKLKGPAARLALRDTGVDLERLGITPADLERYGPRTVIDHTGSRGTRLLVWTE
ncbi:MAG: hypothetical protein ABIT71_08760 [Vicinamibacteraceae bacterium]